MGFWSGFGKVLGGIGAGIAAPLTGGASLTALPTILGGIAGGLSGAGQAAAGSAKGREAENDQLILRDRNETDKYNIAQDAILKLLGQREQGALERGGLDLQNDQNLLNSYVARQRAQLDALTSGEKALMDRAGLELARQQFGLDAHTQLTDQALRADRLANAQPLAIAHPRATIPTITGGYVPSEELRGGMRSALTDRLSQLQRGPQFMDTPTPDFQSGLLPGPTFGYQTPAPTDYSGALLPPPGASQLAQPGFWEKFGSVAGTAGGILGGIAGGSGLGQRQAQPYYLPGRPVPGGLI